MKVLKVNRWQSAVLLGELRVRDGSRERRAILGRVGRGVTSRGDKLWVNSSWQIGSYRWWMTTTPPISFFWITNTSPHTPTPLFITKISLSKDCLKAEMADKRHNRREVRQEKWGEKGVDAGGVRQQGVLNAALVGPGLQSARALYHLFSLLGAKLHLFSNSKKIRSRFVK